MPITPPPGADGDFGEDQIFDWRRRTRSTGDWKAAFAETFGVDVNSWYQQGAALYLRKPSSLVRTDRSASVACSSLTAVPPQWPPG